jgi:hypothetical protein
LFSLGWCVALGGTTALDTLGSQAFTGGNQTTNLSVHLQRCVVLLWILFIPIGFLWVFIEPILLAFGQPESLSNGVQKFLRVLMCGAPGYIGFESLKKYLQCQGAKNLTSDIELSFSLPPSILRDHESLDISLDNNFTHKYHPECRTHPLHAFGITRLACRTFNHILAFVYRPRLGHVPLTHSHSERVLGRFPIQARFSISKLLRVSQARPPWDLDGRYRMVRASGDLVAFSLYSRSISGL